MTNLRLTRRYLKRLLREKGEAEHTPDRYADVTPELPQWIGHYYAANVADLATIRSMLHNALYLTFMLFGGLLASLKVVDDAIAYYLFLFAPLAFFLLHYLHLYDSWLFIHQEFFVRVTLDKSLIAGSVIEQSVPGSELLATPFLVRFFQGTSRQISHLLPAVGTYLLWLCVVRPRFLDPPIVLLRVPFTPLEWMGTMLCVIALGLSLWGWAAVAKHLSRLQQRYP